MRDLPALAETGGALLLFEIISNPLWRIADAPALIDPAAATARGS